MLPALVQMAVLVAAFVVALAIDRRVHADATRRALPQSLELLVAFLAMLPLVALSAGIVPETAVDDTVLAVVVSFALWIALPLAFSRLVGTTERDPRGGC